MAARAQLVTLGLSFGGQFSSSAISMTLSDIFCTGSWTGSWEVKCPWSTTGDVEDAVRPLDFLELTPGLTQSRWKEGIAKFDIIPGQKGKRIVTHQNFASGVCAGCASQTTPTVRCPCADGGHSCVTSDSHTRLGND